MHIKALKFACFLILFIIYNIEYTTEKRHRMFDLLVHQKKLKKEIIDQ